MARYIYRSAAAHVNNEVYQVRVSEGYTTVVPDIYINGVEEQSGYRTCLDGTGVKVVDTPTRVAGLVLMKRRSGPSRPGMNSGPKRHVMRPIKSLDMNKIVFANLTIADMVDIHDNKLFCDISHDRDVIEIFHIVDSYLKEVQPRVQDRVEEYVIYARRLLDFRATLWKLVRRILRSKPDWADAYWNKNGVGAGKSRPVVEFIMMLERGRMGGEKNAASTDPIERLQFPPYTISDAGTLVAPQSTPAPANKPAMSEEEIRRRFTGPNAEKVQYRKPVL